MRRRLRLMVAVFAALLIAFAIYYLIAEKEGEVFPAPTGTAPRPPEHLRGTSERPEFGTVGGPEIISRRHGRLEGIYRAEKLDNLGDGSYWLEKPSVVRYLKQGQHIYISGDEGRIFAEEVARGVNVRRGTLTGNVELVVDLSTDPARKPKEQRPQDLIKIFLDDVEFDNDLLIIRTPGDVKLISQDVDILGKGLAITFNQDPNELRELRIAQGEIMTIRSLTEQMAGRLLADEDDEREGASSAPAEQEEPMPDYTPPADSPQQPAAQATTVPAT
ncbi:MAG: hypothetical protein KAU28_06265, partial [Phycisphaerae bacterium]|nr:hypothetical protein [Phycisphaerae bacterium]